jgi:hypothetical protein
VSAAAVATDAAGTDSPGGVVFFKLGDMTFPKRLEAAIENLLARFPDLSREAVEDEIRKLWQSGDSFQEILQHVRGLEKSDLPPLQSPSTLTYRRSLVKYER